jgi:GTP cyclohydrolase II
MSMVQAVHLRSVSPSPLEVRVVGEAQLPTRFGEFRAVAFVNNRDGREHLALVRGRIEGQGDVPTRLHSECLTGDAFGSLRCDCREQLEKALERLAREPLGVLLYLRQEGRGIGLANKIRAYALQEKGLDTVEANRALGFRDDERDYEVAAAMLRALGLQSVRLLTNNPQKIFGLERHGMRVSARVEHAVPPGPHNRRYLETKVRRSGHLMDLPGDGAP